MTTMKEGKIDFDYLIFAWQDESQDNSYYLDLQTGDIKLVQSGLLDLDDLTDEIEQDRERYLYIPKPEPSNFKEMLCAFTKTIENPQLKRLITVAQESPNVLLALRKVLEGYPTDLSRFEAIRLSSIRNQIDKWLAANFVKGEVDSLNFSP